MHDDTARRGERLDEFVKNAAQAPPEGAEAARSVAAGVSSRAGGDVLAAPQPGRDPWGGTRVRRRTA